MTFRTNLPPGSEKAREEGCICDPNHVEGTPYIVEKACPIHGLGELKAHLDEERRLFDEEPRVPGDDEQAWVTALAILCTAGVLIVGVIYLIATN